MPPKVRTTRDEIVEEAFRLVREEGVEALNARSLAKRMGISTQPIFSNFHNMAQLKEEVLAKASELYFKKLDEAEEKGDMPPLKARGMAYIDFAREEKWLFRLLFMDKRDDSLSYPTDDASREIALVSKSFSLEREGAKRIHALLWFAVHGIASLFATESLELDREAVSQALSDIYQGLKARFCDG